MPAYTLKNNTYALVKNNYVVNVVYASGDWIQPDDVTAVQLYEYESCNVGDYYFGTGGVYIPAGSSPRFQYVIIDENPTFEDTLRKPAYRVASGGADDGTLYVSSSLVVGSGNSGSYVQFPDGTKLYSAVMDGGVF